ncbi:hypothetical protein F4810DRAFT_718129 [Camillea tinctor]|nr:hypothetical protein F4810DRAFT_718129 [Camillea tinctor]
MMTLPITNIIQIIQYLNYLGYSKMTDHASILRSVGAGGGIQGFCAGLLSAIAVASGTSEEEVAELAATSVKLAFCIGAYVDLDQLKHGESSRSSNLAIRLKATMTLHDIQRILFEYPKAYVAVTRDLQEFTVTAPISIVRILQQDLKRRGISALETSVNGRYHSGIHAKLPAKIIEICEGLLDPRFGRQTLVRSNTDACVIPYQDAIHVALNSILSSHSNWHLTISSSANALYNKNGDPFILSIGLDAIPPSVMKTFHVVKLCTLIPKLKGIPNNLASASAQISENLSNGSYSENAVAVIGMSCRFPGADSANEFWDLLTEGKSMLGHMPPSRFDTDHMARSPKGLRFWGNFMRDIECFDHKFFEKSSRESSSMDPQQRLLLEVTYQALESSGYFSDQSKPRDVGCYIGACSADYDSNVGSHPPTAYSTTGTLRAFLSGRLSHYFGWSGPSLTLDTACSSSAVAIHTACSALRNGECSQAIAGGVTLLTSPFSYENLSAAHFLSPSGATKPFDASADGYCRGEGVGVIILKRLSDALVNSDNVLGVIASSAINQNANCVSITVPHSQSQNTLYRRVTNLAGIAPQEVSFIEAHGTGTPIGDPIEMESIREVFGGLKRASPLFVSSVKGNIGHLEGASGVAAIIKALLQMEYRTVCMQASFSKLNPKIASLEIDHMCIPTTNTKLPGNMLTACINNYGAAGSNATMIIMEAPPKDQGHIKAAKKEQYPSAAKIPIKITAGSESSLLRYCRKLECFCQERLSSEDFEGRKRPLENIAFSLARQQNQKLSYMLTLAVEDTGQLCNLLRAQTDTRNLIKQRPSEYPVVLCFGGQVDHHIGLCDHLCDKTLRSMGYPGLYPVIFQTEPISSVFACASAWLDSGLRIAALSISGILSLRDGLRLVAERASLMQDHWGSEPGTMIAVESEQNIIEELIAIEIACYNGPTSVVTVSDKDTADQLEIKLASRSIKHKRLNPLIPHLEALASSLTFNPARIPIETCTKGMSWPEPTAQRIAAHTREPDRFGPCTFLEAGSSSSQPIEASNNFFPMVLNKSGSLERLVDMTIDLWNLGYQLKPWNFHRVQAVEYDHWLELGKTAPVQASSLDNGLKNETVRLPPGLLHFSFTNAQGHYFALNTRSDEYQDMVRGHVVLGKPECPPSIYVELVSKAVKMVEKEKMDWMINIEHLQIESDLNIASHLSVNLKLQNLRENSWNFQIQSQGNPAINQERRPTISHVTGIVSLRSSEEVKLKRDFERYTKLTHPYQTSTVLNDQDDTCIKGPMIYKVFSGAVEYADMYRNVKSIVSSGNRVVGKVSPPDQVPTCLKESEIHPYLLEGFLQVVSLHANYAHEDPGEAIFRLSGIDQIQFGIKYPSDRNKIHKGTSWVVVCFMSTSGDGFTSDLFVYDSNSGNLVLYIFGAQYTMFTRYPAVDISSGNKVSNVSATALERNNKECYAVIPAGNPPEIRSGSSDLPADVTKTESKKPGQDVRALIYEDLRGILETIADVPKGDIKGNSVLEDLGVDSLMIIEVISEISNLYKVELPFDELEHLTDFDSLVGCLEGLGCRSGSQGNNEQVIDTSYDSMPPNDTSGLSSTYNASEYGRPNTKGLREAQLYGQQTKFTDFWENVNPEQLKLVNSYIIEAFRDLGCDISTLAPGQPLSHVDFLPKHEKLMEQLRKIMVGSGFLYSQPDNTYYRAEKAVDPTPSAALFKQMILKYPQHSSETKLLNVTGSQLASCLAGKTDPIKLLFANKVNREIMADVYETAPVCQATTRLLSDFLARSMSLSSTGRAFKILEVGGGTGGTTKYLVEYLNDRGIDFEYTFTDISLALVTQAKEAFKDRHGMRFATYNCNQMPPPELRSKFDIIIATNCIHATKNARSSAENIAALLCDDGIFCLIEFTKRMLWFDVVYGLLEGWWAFEDGRQHALADEWFWDQALRAAGFDNISWTDGDSAEAQTMRVICGFKGAIEKSPSFSVGVTKRAGIPTETFIWKRESDLEFKADVYFPNTADDPTKRRPIALMIHGGGHLLFSRRDIPMKHVRTLLQRGLLPVSIDYRLCPETTLFEGPITDCCDALEWVKETLPFLNLAGPKVTIDPNKLLALGWSSGGQLAMTLGYTARARGIQPPDVILPFYSPSDLEDDFWNQPQYPNAAEEEPIDIWGELDSVQDKPILEYAPMSNNKGAGLSLTLKDDRARLILHMNWKAQAVQVLIRGLPHKSRVSTDDLTDWKALPSPPVERVRECSPYWHILQGTYRTPTFMVHGDNDDWLPHQMSEKTIAALRQRGIPCGIRIAEQCGHAFDLWPREDKLKVGWQAIEVAYDFACEQLMMTNDS